MNQSSLTDEQAGYVERARAILTAEHGYEACDLAERIGRLQWHLGEMLDLVEALINGTRAAGAAPSPSVPGRMTAEVEELRLLRERTEALLGEAKAALVAPSGRYRPGIARLHEDLRGLGESLDAVARRQLPVALLWDEAYVAGRKEAVTGAFLAAALDAEAERLNPARAVPDFG